VPEGYIPMPSDTYTGYALLRSILRSGSETDVARAVAYGRRVKLYPLSQAADPPPTVFTDAIDVVFDATIPYDRRFFESLDRIVQREPWLTRDKAMIDIVKSVGIEKGKRFDPDPATRPPGHPATRPPGHPATRPPGRSSTPPPARRTPGSTSGMTRSSPRRFMKAPSGQCQPRACSWKG
jgi:hypothetical protein